ncbi:MAG: glycosyltransferase family 2 protein [Vibrio sp.]
MSEFNSVEILLATYNGERYLSEQIESLMNQSYKNFTVLISDDGSTDGTVELINKIQDPRFKLVNSERVGGVIKNFEILLNNSSSEYVMLCDQDDVWHKDKVKVSLEGILKEERDKIEPCLGFSDLKLVDENLNLIAPSFYRETKLNPYRNLNINNLSWMGSVYGCTIIMNRAAVQNSLPFPNKLIMHDHWLAYRSLINGMIFFIDKPLLKYRQHNKNVSGGMGYKQSLIKKIFSVQKYSDIKDRAIKISGMHNIVGFRQKLDFLMVILRSIPYCETKKYPILFLISFILYG